MQDALEFNRKSNLDMEKLMTPYTIFQELVLQVAGITMMLTSIICWEKGAMSIANALMCIVMSFLVFGQIKLFGMGMSMLRLASASIDRTLQTEEMEQMDEKGRAFSPKNHGIEFDNVHFSYENKEILHGISVKLPDKTTTAVIGPSGSGKTTLCNLIARFWDAHVIIGTRLEKPSKINGFALLSPNFFMPERGERNHHTSTYIAGQQYESLIAIKATIPSADDGFEGPKSL